MLSGLEYARAAVLASSDFTLAALSFLAIAVAGILIALAAALSLRRPRGPLRSALSANTSRYSVPQGPPITPPDARAGLTIVDSLVFDYIQTRGGVISLGQASMDLRLDEAELRRSIEKLAQRGLLEPY